MNKKIVWFIGLISLFILISGCSSEKKTENEMSLIMETITETESNQNFYLLIESLLINEREDELLKLALDELEDSESKLNSLSIKTKKGKEVINLYQAAFENREVVISILKENTFTDEIKDKLEKNIVEAEENEYEAAEIIIKELKLKRH